MQLHGLGRGATEDEHLMKALFVYEKATGTVVAAASRRTGGQAPGLRDLVGDAWTISKDATAFAKIGLENLSLIELDATDDKVISSVEQRVVDPGGTARLESLPQPATVTRAAADSVHIKVTLASGTATVVWYGAAGEGHPSTVNAGDTLIAVPGS